MKKIAILLVFIMAVATAIEPIDAKPRRSSSRRSSSSFSRSIKRSTSSSYKKSTIDFGTSSTSKKSTTSNNKSTNYSDSNTNTNSKSYTVKKKTSDTISNIVPSLYKNYSRNRYYRRGSNINFWKYYGLYHLFDDDDDEISEAELVRNLEEQGYTEEEIEQILADASLEEYDDIEDEEYEDYTDEYETDTNEAGKSFSIFRIIAFGLGGLILIAGVVIFIISMINRKSM